MARTTTEHSIVIELANLEGVVALERLGSGNITPGHLLDITGGAVRAHNTAEGRFSAGRVCSSHPALLVRRGA